MNRIQNLSVSAALIFLTGAAFAQTPPPPATLEPANAGMSSMAQLDKNGDGFVDKSEVPSGNELAGKFARLDQNSDGKLNAEEFARYQAETR